MNTFYIARHGETLNNKLGRLSGWIDTPLTSTSLEPTERAIAKLKDVQFDAIYSSDSGRAFVTAYIMSRGLGYPHEIIRVPDLREVNYGDAANMLSVEAYKLYPRLDRNTDFTPPNGESLQHMQTRVVEVIRDLDDAHDHETILIVAHSGVMAALRSHYLQTDFGAHNISEPYPHDYVAQFTLADGEIDYFNEMP